MTAPGRAGQITTSCSIARLVRGAQSTTDVRADVQRTGRCAEAMGCPVWSSLPVDRGRALGGLWRGKRFGADAEQ